MPPKRARAPASSEPVPRPANEAVIESSVAGLVGSLPRSQSAGVSNPVNESPATKRARQRREGRLRARAAGQVAPSTLRSQEERANPVFARAEQDRNTEQRAAARQDEHVRERDRLAKQRFRCYGATAV